ncbi:MAG: hypothetical protein WC997_13540 [Porticoccaceae bacterium]
MARTKNTDTDVAQDAALPELDAQLIADAQNTASLLAEHSEERDLVNQLLGQVQMANSFARFADVVSLTKLKHIKETKMYRALAGKKGVDPQGNEIADVGTFDGFCQALGLSRSKVDEDLANLNAFGEHALNQLSALGVGYREMRQYRRLPEDQKEALIEVAKTGDKEAFVELAEEIITRHAKEKAELASQLENTQADYEAQSEVLADKSRSLDEARLELEKARRRIQALPPAEAVRELRVEASGIAYEAENVLTNKVRAAFEALTQVGSESGQDQRLYMAGLLRQLEMQIIALREDYDLPDDVDADTTDWMAPDAVAKAAASLGIDQVN